MYADDLMIMTENVQKMKKVLEICEIFGTKLEVKFNPTKTQIMCLNNKKYIEEKIELCGETVEWVKKLKYLGVWFNTNNNNKDHLQERRMNTWNAYYSLKSIGIEGKDLSPKLKAHLIKTYVRAITYYGLENLTITKTDIKKLQTLEGNMIKKMLGISKRTHTTQLLYALGVEPVEIKLKNNKINFAKRLLENEYTANLFNTLREKQASSNKLIKETYGILGINLQHPITREIIKKGIKTLETKQKNQKNGCCDSIQQYIDDTSESSLNMIKLLVKVN